MKHLTAPLIVTAFIIITTTTNRLASDRFCGNETVEDAMGRVGGGGECGGWGWGGGIKGGRGGDGHDRKKGSQTNNDT